MILFALVGALLAHLAPLVASLGTSCSAPLGAGTAAASDPFWMQNIKHQGIAAFNPNPSGYQVFRNVKDFGARGDGVTDDTAAINAAISTGNRCGQGSCSSSTVTPAVVYFPSGTYLISSPIIPYYYTQLIGDAKNPPTLLASASFAGMAVIDADPYLPNGGGAQWYTNQNNFFRSVRNFIIDVRRVPATNNQGTGIHWQVAQATSLVNIQFFMSTASNTAHQGIWMENGSGGFMGDLVFNGGKFGMWVGNQQFTVRNITVNNANTAVFSIWNWGDVIRGICLGRITDFLSVGWTFQGVTINNCQVGFDLQTGGLTQDTQTVGAEAIIDAVVTNTPIFVRSSVPSNGHLAGSLVINNARLNNVPTAVGVVGGATVLAGGTTTIASWGQGNVYTGTNGAGRFVQGNIAAANKPASLLDGSGRIFGRTRPQYATYAVSQFVSVKDNGARGDGRTDDTAALQAVFDKFAGCKIIFFDAGTYIVTSTLRIPAGTQMIGEGWSVISGKGSAFQNQNSPQAVVQVGAPGSQGVVEITDIIFSTVGPTAGAIVVEWNVKQPNGMQGGAGMWDSHIRLGGAAGTNLETNCPTSQANNPSPNCFAAFLALHLTSGSTAYLEGTWVWLADHDLDGNGSSQISLYSGRGILSESAGPVWMIGTASEHHTLYQYNLVNAASHYMGLIQTETAYYQPAPNAPAPFSVNSAFHDPTTFVGGSGWALRVATSTDIIVFGAGLYSFFQHYQAPMTASRANLPPLRPGTAAPGAPYWREIIKHQGTSPFHPKPSTYKVWRNVKEYGAKGDGRTDDSGAINRAISDGGRCGGKESTSSTITPAVVYFPPGTYLVKKAITPYYYTQLLGDARNPPTLLADASFRDMAIIDADPYIPGGHGKQWFVNQNNFYRSVKNFVIDTQLVPPEVSQGTGIHWQVSQGTSLQNIKFYMSNAPNTAHQGIWMENGSGGFMGDLEFNGGKFGMWVGNQQFTVRNVVFNNAQTAVFGVWNWGWTFQKIEINNCSIGFDLLTGGLTPDTQSVGSEALIDVVVKDTNIFIHTSTKSQGYLAGSIILNNIDLQNVKVAIAAGPQNQLVSEGGTRKIEAWAQGNVYRGSDPENHFVQGEIVAPKKAKILLDDQGRIVSKARPQYEDYSLDQIVSVKDLGARGDGKTDDTRALQHIFDEFADKKIIFVDAGTYLITNTLTIPPGSRITGEVWSIIAGTGDAFRDPSDPRVMIRVGEEGSQGIVEISDILFSTVGPTPGAILVEWNIREPEGVQAGAGLWDTHIRLGGAAGSQLESDTCPRGNEDYEDSTAAFLSIHLTPKSTAYFEATWVWLADHDLDRDGTSQISVFAGRGILSESQGPVWLIGTSEHFTIFQYNLVNARNHYIGFAQTESPYYQPKPVVPKPFSLSKIYHDPEFPEDLKSSWALAIKSSEDILVFGGGFYSFFYNYEQDRLKDKLCQTQIVNVDSTSRDIQLYSISTVGVPSIVSVDGRPVVKESDNHNGFASTATVWTSA
ncbi:hypothetical protein D9758_001646 [Tetrapyrgos nigripes]|uniref:Rhamnogalacturonase A/B/Epimerase-like pectate lyase domain-containing protein n=1 Tax=Tetrapyrgos nigripes TaxID=182062 RepID=A0A8H5GXD7_9AGAR|nr:hypothetical protein D9758_001646 [Tetrapyrgos nigripes]